MDPHPSPHKSTRVVSGLFHGDDQSLSDHSFHSSAETETKDKKGRSNKGSVLGRKLQQLTPKQCHDLVAALQNKFNSYKLEMDKKEADYKKQLDKVEQKLAAVSSENTKLQKQLRNSHPKFHHDANTNNLDVTLPIKEDLKQLIIAQAKTILWSVVKFIQSPEQEIMAASMLIKCAENLPEEDIATKEDREALANTYKTHIRRAILKRRNYVAAEHKKVMFKRFKDKGSMPTVSQLIKCLERNIQDEEDFEVFEFYWEELLPKQVGSWVWSHEVRNYTTICEAIRKDITTRKLPMITSEDEAFTVLVVENSYDRWMKELQKTDAPLPQPADNAGVQQRNNPGKPKRPCYNGLYTTTESGQNDWGGWKEEGLARFNEFVDMNTAARAKKTTPALEKDCLARLKKKHNIVCDDHRTQADLDKKRKRKGDDDLGDIEKKKPLLTFRPQFHGMFSDDEEGEDLPPLASSKLQYHWSNPDLPTLLLC